MTFRIFDNKFSFPQSTIFLFIKVYLENFHQDRGFLVPFFSYFIYLESGFLSVAYFEVANLAQLGIPVSC